MGRFGICFEDRILGRFPEGMDVGRDRVKVKGDPKDFGLRTWKDGSPRA